MTQNEPLPQPQPQPRRNRGGQPGNQNARKQDFYSKVLVGTRKSAFKRAVEVQGLDQEIALLRLKIQSVLETDPGNIKLIGRDARTLAMLVTAKNKIPEDTGSALEDAIRKTLSAFSFSFTSTESSHGRDVDSSTGGSPEKG